MVDLLMVQRGDKMGVLMNSMPKPTDLVPLNGLPEWEELPLDAKVPMLYCPVRSIIFSRNRLGRKLDNSPGTMFRLSDTYTRSEYDPLHDPNLQKFLYHEENIKFFEKHGQISYSKDVICSLKQFNEYRQYLNKMRLEQVIQERERMDAESKDQYLYRKAQEMTRKKLARHIARVAQSTKREQIEQQRIDKIYKDLERQYMQCFHRQMEKEQFRMINKEIQEIKDREYQNKIGRVKEAARLKIATLKHKMHLREKLRVRRLKRRLALEAKIKADEKVEQWFEMLEDRQARKIGEEMWLRHYKHIMGTRVARRIQQAQFLQERLARKAFHAKMNAIRSRYENKKLERLIEVVKEEVHRKVKRDKIEQSKINHSTKNSRAGLSPIVAPFRTPDESEHGLCDPPSGYDAIDDATIEKVVTLCSNNEKILNGENFATMRVLVAAKYIFDRLATGPVDELPNDPDVLKTGLILVDSVVSRTRERIFDFMVTLIKRKYEPPETSNENNIKSSTTLNRTIFKSPRFSNVISFKEMYKKAVYEPKPLIVEKYTTLRTMTRSALETPSFHDDIAMPIVLEDEKLFHLSQRQKLLIIRNLDYLEMMLSLQLEQIVVARFDINAMMIKRCRKHNQNCYDGRVLDLTNDNYTDLLARAMASILTKPEMDEHFSNNILELSENLGRKVLHDLRNYIDFGEMSQAERVPMSYVALHQNRDEDGESEENGFDDFDINLSLDGENEEDGAPET